MSSTITALQNQVATLVDSLNDAAINLQEHLKGPENFNEFNASVAEKIADLEDSILEAKVTLPDGTGREIFVWEYAALEKLAADNVEEIVEFLENRIAVENGSVVKAIFWYLSLSNISALSGLTNLKKLNLQGNQIHDIGAVTGLTNLQELNVGDNQIQNISAVASLANLQFLDLSRNHVMDMSALSSLTNLRELYLHSNQIQDISAVSGLKSLKELHLFGNRIQDINAISGLTNLEKLSLIDNPIQASQIAIIQALKARGVKVSE